MILSSVNETDPLFREYAQTIAKRTKDAFDSAMAEIGITPENAHIYQVRVTNYVGRGNAYEVSPKSGGETFSFFVDYLGYRKIGESTP